MSENKTTKAAMLAQIAELADRGEEKLKIRYSVESFRTKDGGVGKSAVADPDGMRPEKFGLARLKMLQQALPGMIAVLELAGDDDATFNTIAGAWFTVGDDGKIAPTATKTPKLAGAAKATTTDDAKTEELSQVATILAALRK